MIAAIDPLLDAAQAARCDAAAVVAFHEAIRESGICGTKERIFEVVLAWLASGRHTPVSMPPGPFSLCPSCGMPMSHVMGMTLLWKDGMARAYCPSCVAGMQAQGWRGIDG